MPKEPKLSQTDYVNRQGKQCPYCLEKTVSLTRDWSLEGTMMLFEAECLSCNDYWIEEYELAGYREEI